MSLSRFHQVGMIVTLSCLYACAGADFAGGSKKASDLPAKQSSPAQPAPGSSAALPDKGQDSGNSTDANSAGAAPAPGPAANNGIGNVIKTIGQIISSSPTPPPATVPPNTKPCGQSLSVSAKANPYLAGMPDGTSLTYTLKPEEPQTPTDKAPDESPVLASPLDPSCIAAGATIAFDVVGGVAYSQAERGYTANGDLGMIRPHQLGASLGKSDITAPMSSLVAVFLSDGDPSKAQAPATLDFSTQASRDYQTLSPALGQVFFVGNGRTSGGASHGVVVPQGATRLYFGVMDWYQWNNNQGGLHVTVLLAKP